MLRPKRILSATLSGFDRLLGWIASKRGYVIADADSMDRVNEALEAVERLVAKQIVPFFTTQGLRWALTRSSQGARP